MKSLKKSTTQCLYDLFLFKVAFSISNSSRPMYFIPFLGFCILLLLCFLFLVLLFVRSKMSFDDSFSETTTILPMYYDTCKLMVVRWMMDEEKKSEA